MIKSQENQALFNTRRVVVQIKYDLAEPCPKEIPTPERGHYAFMKALPLSVLVFMVILGADHLLPGLLERAGASRISVEAAYAGTLLLVAALFMQILLDSGKQRNEEDKVAVGVLNNGFWVLANGLKTQPRYNSLKDLEWLAWCLYRFLNGDRLTVYYDGKALKGSKPVLARLLFLIDLAKLTPDMKYQLLTQVTEMSKAIGGIASRRIYPILKSRYLVNILFCFAGVLMVSLAESTGEGNHLLGQGVVFLFTFGLTTVLMYIRHMEFGIGYDPGDIRPDHTLAQWLSEIEAARSN